MKWSKQKKHIELLLAESVKGRLAFHNTRYRSGGGISGYLERGWITWDGKELVNFATSSWWNEFPQLTMEIDRTNAFWEYGSAEQPKWWYRCSNFAQQQATALLTQQGIFTRYDLLDALTTYVDLSIDSALQSDNPIIRALAMVDRRVGKRRLAKMDALEFEHPLVRQLYTLRCEAEGLKVATAQTA